MDDQTQLKRTPLYDFHVSLGAKMVPFAGYDMPVQYPAGVLKEHLQTRTNAGLFDVSHMGQLRLSGPDAAAAFESLMPVDVIGLAPGKHGANRTGRPWHCAGPRTCPARSTSA